MAKLNIKEQQLFDALMNFSNNDKEKVQKIILKLFRSNDIPSTAAQKMFDLLDDEEPETRAKTVIPQETKKMSIPPQYDKCGSLMSADEVIQRDKRIAELRKEREEEKRIRSMPRYDPCGSSSSYC